MPKHVFSAEDTARMEAAGITTGVAEKAARFTFDDVCEMMRIGALDPDAKVELIDGELVEMAPQNAPHMYAKHELFRTLAEQLDRSFVIQVEGTLALAPGVAPNPDIFVHAASKHVDRLTGADVLLLIEVADSSILRDLQTKAALYARYGIADYWVVDAYGRRIFVHRRPTADGYAEVIESDRDADVTPLAFPDLVVRVADLPSAD